jgi:hypothetical protein
MDTKERHTILNDIARKMGGGGAGINTASWLKFVKAIRQVRKSGTEFPTSSYLIKAASCAPSQI